MIKRILLQAIIFITFFSLLSCKNNDSAEECVVVKAKNNQITVILDSLLSHSSKWKDLDWSKQYACTVEAQQGIDNVEFIVSFIAKEMSKSDLQIIKNKLYGVFQYKKQYVLVFGGLADTLFTKTPKTKSIDFLTTANVLDDNEYMPPCFDPDMFVYYIERDTIRFKYYGWR